MSRANKDRFNPGKKDIAFHAAPGTVYNPRWSVDISRRYTDMDKQSVRSNLERYVKYRCNTMRTKLGLVLNEYIAQYKGKPNAEVALQVVREFADEMLANGLAKRK
jgi:hypothetical protein